jgi:hypothetical protein
MRKNWALFTNSKCDINIGFEKPEAPTILSRITMGAAFVNSNLPPALCNHGPYQIPHELKEPFVFAEKYAPLLDNFVTQCFNLQCPPPQEFANIRVAKITHDGPWVLVDTLTAFSETELCGVDICLTKHLTELKIWNNPDKIFVNIWIFYSTDNRAVQSAKMYVHDMINMPQEFVWENIQDRA